MSDNDLLIQRITEAVNASRSGETELLQEQLDQVNAQLAFLKAEDIGWMALNGNPLDKTEGLTLDQLKQWSEKLREQVAGSPLPKQANALRYSYTMSQPFLIPDLKEKIQPRGPGRPAKTKSLNEFYHDPVNQRYVFGKAAQELISTTCSTDGIYFALGDDETKKVRAVPLHEIVGLWLNPDFPDEVWAYERQWTPDPSQADATKTRWYYTDRYEGERASSLPSNVNDTQKTEVDQTKTMLDFTVNRQTGWSLGTPDLMAGQLWNRAYITMMNHGKEVSEAQAHFAMVVKTQSKAGSQSAGIKSKGQRQAGNTAFIPVGNEIGALMGAKTSYDFGGLRPIAEIYAASVGVSVIDLLASPAAAGSSYGSAQALAPAMRRGIESRRGQLAEWMQRIIKWGTDEDKVVTPARIDEVDIYRENQMVLAAHNTGLYHPDEIRGRMAYLSGITLTHNAKPAGYLLPNNEKSLPRKDVDTDGTAPTGTTNPTQGQDNGTGGGDSATSNDLRDDTQT